MPSFKDFEKILPVSGSEGSKLHPSSMSDPTESSRKVSFDTAMEKADPKKIAPKQEVAEVPPEASATKAQHISPIELSKTQVTAPPTIEGISEQATRLQKQLQSVQESMKKVQVLDATPEQTNKMNTFIQHVDQGLEDIAKLTKKVEVGSKKAIAAIGEDKPPLVRFLSYLTESDHKLDNFMTELGGLKIGQQKLTPDVMMAVQVKLGFITQELDFFTAVLNKALESTKTVMNVQI